MPPSAQTHDDTPCASPDPLLGGTLALMSFYARTQHTGAARKIARNLALLAQHPELPPSLQIVCRRLFGDWVRAAQEPVLPGPHDLHDEPPLMQ